MLKYTETQKRLRCKTTPFYSSYLKGFVQILNPKSEQYNKKWLIYDTATSIEYVFISIAILSLLTPRVITIELIIKGIVHN